MPAILTNGELETAVEMITGVPPQDVPDPLAFVMVTVVVVEAVTGRLLALLPVQPVQPDMVTTAPTQPFVPAPVSVAANV